MNNQKIQLLLELNRRLAASLKRCVGMRGWIIMNRDSSNIMKSCRDRGLVKQRWMRVTSVVALAGLVSFNAIVLNGQSASASPLPLSAVLLNATPEAAAKLPGDMVNTLRQDLSKITGLPSKKLRVAEATEKTWSDGCLGLGKADEMCSQAMVKGWRVVLTNGVRRWVYRTDAVGRAYRLETPVNQTKKMPPAPIRKSDSSLPVARLPVGELPQRLEKGVVFRAIASGGFTGRTSQTTLLNDGRMTRVWLRSDGTASAPEVHQVSLDKVRQFQQSLQAHSFGRFHRQNYSATPGSADFITVTLSSRQGTVRYADSIQAQLPEDLRSIITAWNGMAVN
jgi:hypothetical protein